MRKLASVRVVESVHPIPDADKIEMVVIDGWQVVSQKGNFKAGDKCVYFEIDSVFEKDSVVGLSLPVDKATRVHTEEKGYVDEAFRIKTIKLRGQISQGYTLPVTYFEGKNVDLDAEDLTTELNVLKYDKPESWSGPGAGRANTAGSFPTDYVKKTDQERAQNLKRTIYDHYVKDTPFQVTYKLDGSSETIARLQVEGAPKDYICSRNLALKLDNEEDTSHFLVVGKPILAKMIEMEIEGLALQGELVSPGIQKNFEGVSKPEFYLFNVFSQFGYTYLPPAQAKEFADRLGIKHVPILHHETTLEELFGEGLTENELLAKLLEYAEGPSGLNGKYREGLVYKSLDGQFSFKTISNSYLLKEK